MAIKSTYVSDLSDEEIDEKELVTIQVTRVGSAGPEVTTSHISDDELAALMEESDGLGQLILHD